MTVAIWRIAADTPAYEAHDLSGKGAELHGGRWNRSGRAVVYTSSSIALACLETIAHHNQAALPLNRFLVRVDVPLAVWNARRILSAESLHVGGTAIPEGKVSLNAGDAWLAANDAAILMVPSVIVPEELNALINAGHPDAQQLVAQKVRAWRYHSRVRTGP